MASPVFQDFLLGVFEFIESVHGFFSVSECVFNDGDAVEDLLIVLNADEHGFDGFIVYCSGTHDGWFKHHSFFEFRKFWDFYGCW